MKSSSEPAYAESMRLIAERAHLVAVAPPPPPPEPATRPLIDKRPESGATALLQLAQAVTNGAFARCGEDSFESEKLLLAESVVQLLRDHVELVGRVETLLRAHQGCPSAYDGERAHRWVWERIPDRKRCSGCGLYVDLTAQGW